VTWAVFFVVYTCVLVLELGASAEHHNIIKSVVYMDISVFYLQFFTYFANVIQTDDHESENYQNVAE
jgi:hypothetical protein